MNQYNQEQFGYKSSDEISLEELFKPLINSKWLIVFFCLFFTLLSIYFVSQLRPLYKATAILQIGNNVPKQGLVADERRNDSNYLEQIKNTQYALFESKEFIQRIVNQLDLRNTPIFFSNKYHESFPLISKDSALFTSLNDAVAIFESNFQIEPIKNTELIKLSYSSYSPDLAKDIVNHVGKSFITYLDEMYSSSQENTTNWLMEKLDELAIKLESSETELQDFREKEKIIDIADGLGLVTLEINTLKSSLIEIEKKADELGVKVAYIDEFKTNIERLSSLPEVYNNPKFISLINLEESLEIKLSDHFGPAHPELISVTEDLKIIRKRIKNKVLELTELIKKEYESTQKKVEISKRKLSEVKNSFLSLNKLNNKFSKLKREVETNTQLYNTYLLRLKETDALGNYQSNFHVRFIDKATTPVRPFAPKKKLIIVLVFILSFLIICSVIIIRSLMKNTLDSTAKLENFTHVPILAVLPTFKKYRRDKSDNASFNLYVDDNFKERIRTLRTTLFHRKEKFEAKIIAITSSEPNEGKSTIAMQVASVFGEMEKVLLIECDLRNPTIANTLALNPFRPGLTNLLAKTHSIDKCLLKDDNLKIDILTSGIIPKDPIAFLSMKRFSFLLKVFGQKYDRIIIETPPINVVSDAIIVTKQVDSVLYIVNGEKTKIESINNGLKILKQMNVNVEGIVINQSKNADRKKYDNKYYNQGSNIFKLPIKRIA